MEKIKSKDRDSIRSKGSNALIYGFGYHDIFGDVLGSPHLSEYGKAPVMTLLGLNIEICLKGIIMTMLGTEPWKGDAKKGHSIKFLLEHIPQTCMEWIYEDLSSHEFPEDKAKAMISKLDKAFVDYRYHYENVEQEIDSLSEDFLQKLWNIIYELSLKVQREYMDNYV